MKAPEMDGAAAQRDAGSDPNFERLGGVLGKENDPDVVETQQAVAQEARLGFVFEAIAICVNEAIGALVALGAGDFDLAHVSLSKFTASARYALRTWEEHEATRRGDGDIAAMLKGGRE